VPAPLACPGWRDLAAGLSFCWPWGSRLANQDYGGGGLAVFTACWDNSPLI